MKKCLIVFALCALLLVTYSLPVIIPNSDKDIAIIFTFLMHAIAKAVVRKVLYYFLF